MPARRLPSPRVLFAAAIAATLAAGAGGAVREAHMDGRLLRAEPDAIAAQPDLHRYALARGEPAYRRNCAACHGAQLKGDRGRGIPNLVDADWLYGDGSREAVFRSIAQGRAGACPAFDHRLPPAVLRAVAVFVHDRAHPAGSL